MHAMKHVTTFATTVLASVGAALVLAFTVSTAQAQTSTGQFAIKEYAPRAGTSILRDAVRSPRLPINKKFAELNASERQSLVSYYPTFDANNEPPYPADGLRPMMELALKAQNKLVEKGRVFLWVSVDAAGKTTEVKVVDSPSPDMTKALAGVMFYTNFKPARCGGAACAMDFPLELEFPDNAM